MGISNPLPLTSLAQPVQPSQHDDHDDNFFSVLTFKAVLCADNTNQNNILSILVFHLVLLLTTRCCVQAHTQAALAVAVDRRRGGTWQPDYMLGPLNSPQIKINYI